MEHNSEHQNQEELAIPPSQVDAQTAASVEGRLLAGISDINRHDALLDAIQRYPEKWWKRGLPKTLAIGLLNLLMLGVVFGLFPELSWLHSGVAQAILVVLITTGVVTLLLSDWSQGNRLRALQACECEPDFRFTAADLPHFMPALNDEIDGVRGSAVSVVKRILSNVQPSDETNVSPRTMRLLFAAMHGRDRELSLAVLTALERIGDERALPEVEKIADGRGAGCDESVARRANEILPALRLRAGQSRAQRILLRPAHGPDERDRLLRVAGHAETAERILLRVAETDPDE